MGDVAAHVFQLLLLITGDGNSDSCLQDICNTETFWNWLTT